MDWPSRELSQRLAEWGLCTPQDLQRSRGAVRKLVRDLPSFDSAWIDVLLQRRVLTADQARILDSTDPDRLRIGKYVIQDCLEENAWRSVYRARPIEGGPSCLLTLHPVHPDDRVAALRGIDATISALAGTETEGLQLPRRASVSERELFIESGDVHGTSLRELLVRRGRFPAAVMLAIARAIVPMLASLEGRGVAHGDLRPRNVWLDHEGQLHLLHAGSLPAVLPTFCVTPELPIEVCDGAAPELLKSHSLVDSHSDQYAFGCLLWQLAAGRPPFPTGDAQGKVAAHRSKRIPELRDLAPMTPDVLAVAIRRLTQREPAGRYGSFREVALHLGPPTRADRRLLRRFFLRFETEAPTQTARETQARPSQWPGALAAVVISGATLWLFTSAPASLGSRHEPQASGPPRRLPTPAGATAIPAAPVAPGTAIVQTSGIRTANRQVEPLPEADPSGIITLNPGATYAARSFSLPGPLTVRAGEGGTARLVVEGPTWDVAADQIRLENIQLECGAAVRFQSRRLEVVRCIVMTNDNSASAGLEWRPQDAAAASPGTLTFTDSHFAATGIRCLSRPSMIRFTNCLKTGAHALVSVPPVGRAHQALPVHLIYTTLRDSASLIEWSPGSRSAGLRIDVTTKACVFVPAAGTPLLALAGSVAPAEWERSIGVSGLESLIAKDSTVIDLVPPPGKPRGVIDGQKLEVDGLMRATVEFFGPVHSDPGSSGLRSTDAIFSVDRPPGIDVEKMPQRVASDRG